MSLTEMKLESNSKIRIDPVFQLSCHECTTGFQIAFADSRGLQAFHVLEVLPAVPILLMHNRFCQLLPVSDKLCPASSDYQ